MGGVLDSAINETLLSVETTNQRYALGFVYKSFEGGIDPSVKEYIYIKTVSTALVKGGVYAISRSTTADYTATVPSASDVNVQYGVALYPVAIGSYAFVQISGNIAELGVAGSTTTGYAIKPTIGAATGTSEGSATLSNTTFAVATSTSASKVSAFIFGKSIPSSGSIVYINQNWRQRADGTTLYTEYSTDNFVTIAWASSLLAE